MANKNISQVIILAGGRGLRLVKNTHQSLPKILTKFGSITMLEDILKQLSKTNLRKVLFLLGYQSEYIVNEINNLRPKFKLQIDYFVEDSPLGTGGALLNAYKLGLLEKNILILHGDLVIRMDINKFIGRYQKIDCDLLMLVHPSSHPNDSDLVEIDLNNKVKKIHTKPRLNKVLVRNLSNAGIYAVNTQILGFYEKKGADLDRNIIPDLVNANFSIFIERNMGFVRDMGTPERLKEITNMIETRENKHRRPALFIDRDGTINVEKGLITSWQQIEVYEDAARLVKRFNDLGYWVFVLTNQSVIARGLITRNELQEIHAQIDSKLSEFGAFVDDYFYCPHHPDSGFYGEIKDLKIICRCRKPGPGLVEECMRKYAVNLRESLLVGNSWRDKVLAENLGISSFIVNRRISNQSEGTISSLDEIQY